MGSSSFKPAVEAILPRVFLHFADAEDGRFLIYYKEMEFYQINSSHKESFSAWGKAPTDVAKTAARMGAVELDVSRCNLACRIPSKLQHLHWYWRCLRCFGMKRHSALLLQHPFYNGVSRLQRFENWLMFLMVKLHSVRIVMVVHDVGHWRKMVADDMVDNESRFLQTHADYIVVHNAAMRSRLAMEGVSNDKMIELRIFDYLLDGFSPVLEKDKFKSVVVAGNLRPDKVPYLTRLAEVRDVNWHLYGKLFDGSIQAENIHYEGCFPSEEVPRHLKYGFGLVWDGESIDGCTGNTGNYLRYNNPHKLSLYLASGLPVIVWKESATAPFVKEHGVGMTVGSLKEIGDILVKLTEAQYMEMRQKAVALSEKLRSGHFMTVALQKALTKIKDGSK